ncbi:MAG: hypothetical protein AUJ49_12085 [Desulfovibrionaceae bacterium CG1_02_65_16]|nr:MAG: hypothetical protein AUJ49_12085 [Desulfovibrionaceae bacterium CG1_02_65_16]
MNRMPQHNQPLAPRPVTLPNDFGAPIGITASMVAEDIHFSTDTGVLTVEKLYRSAEGKTAYGIISASGESRERRAYLLEEQGDTVLADNGNFVVELDVTCLHEFLVMALQDEDARKTVGEHVQMRPAVNED